MNLPFDGDPVAVYDDPQRKSGISQKLTWTFDKIPTHLIKVNSEVVQVGCICIFVSSEEEAKRLVYKCAEYGTAFCWKEAGRYKYFVRHFPRFDSEMPSGFVNYHTGDEAPKPFTAKAIKYLRYGNEVFA